MPACTRSKTTTCPTDVPAHTTAIPECALTIGGSSPNRCALICKPGSGSLAVGDGGCPADATCRTVQGGGVCTYGGPPPPPPPPPSVHPHYGDPAKGCLNDEINVFVNGVPGDWCSPSCGAGKPCPTDFPKGTTASPDCALAVGGTSPNRCVLLCNPASWRNLSVGDGGCPPGAGCHAASGKGICTYPKAAPPGAYAHCTESTADCPNCMNGCAVWDPISSSWAGVATKTPKMYLALTAHVGDQH